MSFLDFYKDEPEIHTHEFLKSKKRVSCEFCSAHWGTIIRVFEDEKEFEESPYYGGGDTVINDPNGVKIAVWAGKNNIGRSPEDFWLCAPVHVYCGCEFTNNAFRNSKSSNEELEDWYSTLEFD
ncbi:MAG: hypothetical protein HS129_05085 [Leptospiraceae bacterium]|nr:hypothetical protein [Leptospiraceae bacterium]NUM41968.1 hypothetical protein [Leptospiraceae bacterium]